MYIILHVHVRAVDCCLASRNEKTAAWSEMQKMHYSYCILQSAAICDDP